MVDSEKFYFIVIQIVIKSKSFFSVFNGYFSQIFGKRVQKSDNARCNGMQQ